MRKCFRSPRRTRSGRILARTGDFAKAEQDILWDVDWIAYDLQGVYKLSVTDNGNGMTGPDMVKYINHLSSSGGLQAHHANFGVGAKIAAATRNQAGLVYLSWRDGIGSMIHLWKDPQLGDYGLQQIQRPEGTFRHWGHLEDDVKPSAIDAHGTKVVLLGNTTDADTMVPPEGSPSPSRWVTRYLNTRYFRFPKGISIKDREGWTFDRSDKDRNVLRTITGQKKIPRRPRHFSGQGRAFACYRALVDSQGRVRSFAEHRLYRLIRPLRGFVEG